MNARALIEPLPVGVVLYDRKHGLLLANETLHRMLALEPGALGPPTSLADMLRLAAERGIIGPADIQHLVRRSIESADGERRFRHQSPNGSMFEAHHVPLPAGGHLALITDITALVEARDELCRQAALTASIVAQVPHGISVYGPDRRLFLLNDAYGEIMAGAHIQLGESIDDIIDRRARSGEYGAGDPAELAQSQRQHDNSRPQFRRRKRPNGAVVDVRTAPLPDGSHISVVTDATALITAETELARRGEAIEALLAHTRHGVVVWDRDHCLLAANAAAVALLQVPDGLLVPGRRLDEVIRSELERGNFGEGADARARAQALATLDRRQPHREQRSTRHGRTLDVRSEPTPQGGFVMTYVDLTDAREAEEALHLSILAADAANAAKTRFLATVGADLRHPLTTILAQADALARHAMGAGDAPLGPHRELDAAQVADACGKIGTAALGLLGSLDAILDLTRLDAGAFDLAQDRVDLKHLLRAVGRRCEAQAAAAEVALLIDVPETMPTLHADETRLRQALSNVVTHAIRCAGPMGSCSVGARHDWARGSILIEVLDSGPGLTQTDLERAFDPFAAGTRQASGRAGGAGLGLYVSRVLMRAHGGELTLRQAPGHGAIATLLIPANRVLREAGGEAN